jgi:hypothetical protein
MEQHEFTNLVDDKLLLFLEREFEDFDNPLLFNDLQGTTTPDEKLSTYSFYHYGRVQKALQKYTEWLNKRVSILQQKTREHRPHNPRHIPPKWVLNDKDLKLLMNNPRGSLPMMFKGYNYLWNKYYPVDESLSLAREKGIPLIKKDGKEYLPILLKEIDYKDMGLTVGCGMEALHCHLRQMQRSTILPNTGKKFHMHGQPILAIGYFVKFGNKINRVMSITKSADMKQFLLNYDQYAEQKRGKK